MTTAPRAYRGVSSTDRLEHRRHQFMSAVVAVADAVGWRNVTVDRVAAQAGLSKRYFYEAFADLDNCAAAAIEVIAQGLQTALAATVDGSRPFAEYVDASMTAIVDYLSAEPARARMLFGELAAGDAVAAARAGARSNLVGLVATTGRAARQSLNTSDLLIETSATMLISGTGQVVLSWLDHGLPISREQLIANLSALWLLNGDGVTAVLSASPSERRSVLESMR